MTGPWHHPPGTLRALLTTFKNQYVICRRCRRFMRLKCETKDLDRPYKPCPFRCEMCKQRGAIVFEVPEGFSPAGQDLGPPRHRPSF